MDPRIYTKDLDTELYGIIDSLTPIWREVRVDPRSTPDFCRAILWDP